MIPLLFLTIFGGRAVLCNNGEFFTDSQTFVGPEPMTIQRNHLLGVLPVWGPQFQIKVDLKINSWLGDKWGSIFRFTADPEKGNCCQVGQRLPGLWTQHGSNDKLHLATNMDGNGNVVFVNEMGNFQPGMWYSFVISQRKEENDYYYSVDINGVRKVHIKISLLELFENVRVFACDQHNDVADAEIRNFEAYSFSEPDNQTIGSQSLVGGQSVPVRRNQLLTVLKEWGPEYEIKLDLKINSWIGKWGSILRFTADPAEGNCCQVGQRIPGLWTQQGSSDTLHLVTNINGHGSHWIGLGGFQTRLWYSFVISQREEGGDFYFSVEIDGVRKVHIRNNQPETFENVKVYACDQHDYVADAEIRNVEVNEIAVETIYPNIPIPEPTEEPTKEPTEKPTDYCSLSSDHTMCKYIGPSESCASNTVYRELSADAKKAILDLHNDLRRKVAKGEETNGVNPPQPGATNMRKLVWNSELEAIAQRWADQCTFGHDIARNKIDGTSVGQNVYVRGGYRQEASVQGELKHAVQLWYDEVRSPILGFNSQDIKPFVFNYEAGHYTQVAWAETEQVGCGMTYYKTPRCWTTLVVCNYAVAGNIQGGVMYNPGPACTDCPDGYICDDGLCSKQ